MNSRARYSITYFNLSFTLCQKLESLMEKILNAFYTTGYLFLVMSLLDLRFLVCLGLNIILNLKQSLGDSMGLNTSSFFFIFWSVVQDVPLLLLAYFRFFVSNFCQN